MRRTAETTVGSIFGERRLGQLHARRLRRALEHYDTRQVMHTYGTLHAKVWISDPVSAGWYDVDWPGPLPEIELLATSQLRPDATVFDLGAHQCVVAMILADRVGPRGRVVAVEANAHNCDMARRNLASNAVGNVTVVEAAVGGQRGLAAFTCDLNGQIDDGEGARGTTTVPLTTVDDLAADAMPDVVFIDVEGYECHVLAGAAGQLASRRPDFFVEVHLGGQLESFGGRVEDIVASFDSGYRFYVASGERQSFVPVDRQGPFPGTRFFLVALAGDR